MTPLNGGCVFQDSIPTNAVEKWDVQQGKTYRVTLSNLTDCATGGTDSTIQVLVKSSQNGNMCLTATKQSTGVYTFTVTMPPNACSTYPIQYCVVNCTESTDASFIARRADGGSKASHLNAATFGAGCSNPTDDTNCTSPSTITLQCPTGVTACNDPNRCDAVVQFNVTATTVCPPAVIVCNPASGSTFVKGPTTVNCTGTDAAGTVAGCQFTVTVADCQAPNITCPGNITAQCTSPSGAAVTFSVSATDNCDASPTVSCVPSSGSTFSFGTTQVCCTATDDDLNSSQCCFNVTVVDTTGPTISCPTSFKAECTSGSGANVNFTVTAIDACDSTPAIVCTPSSGSLFPIGTTQVCCTATDDSNNSNSCCFNVTIQDGTPPAITCPGNITAECPSASGATVTYTTTATDTCDSTPAIVCTPPSGSTFGFGPTQVCCTATDDSGNSTECCFDVTVVDTIAPSIQCPANITAECSSEAGATALFEATAADACDPNVTVVCVPASGSTFGFGTTQVCCTATDDRTNSSQCCFDVTVVDTAPPAIACPTDITAECTSASGAAVSYTVTARDKCDLEPTIVCSPASGAAFGFGTTQVCCTATDNRQNTSQCCFDVTVVDTTPPAIQCPANITTECTSASGAAVTFAATATDLCDATPAIVCTPASGSTFGFGTTQVCCTATDDSNNSSQCCFDVTVVDTTAPSIQCPYNLTRQCQSADGKPVTFSVTATDLCDANPTIECDHASGSTFPIGSTQVCCTATDDSQNASQCCFTITIVDTQPPAITCPTDITAECTSASGAAVAYTVTATDTCDPNTTIVCSPASGSTFAFGTTQVCCTATDDSKNSAQCCFNVIVVDTVAPSIHCPYNINRQCLSADGKPVTFTVTATDLCDANPTIECDHASGSTFPIGSTQVCCTATDDSQNASQCCFTITIVDTRPPTITCPADITEECADPNGATVSYTVTATDTCDESPTIACTPASGSNFGFGTTPVCCTATDDSSNSAQCCFNVTVVDTTAPALQCPSDFTAECTSANGAAVTFTVTATDACDSTPTIVCTPPSGSNFGYGTTQVCCTATDDAQNSSQCCFNVTVANYNGPSIQCPTDITAECTSVNGAAVTYSVTASADCGATPTIVCSPPSGSLFPFGPTQVCCTATDDQQNSARCCFNVTVVDTVAPTIDCPDDIRRECTSASGKTVYFTVTATDLCDPEPTIVCDHASGSTFPIGTTTVCCTATDDHTNASQCCFSVTIVDSASPRIACPEAVTAECTSPSGAAVSYTVTATDTCDALVAVVCDHPSGSAFPFGTTRVCCTARDDAGNSAQCCFDVTVVDTTPPALRCPTNTTAECTSPDGATVSYTVTATDLCDSSPTVVCNPPSGSSFSFGPTTICCTATDDHQNSSRCCFDITVVDTTAPTLYYSDTITASCTGALTTVTWEVTATDLCDPSPVIDCDHESGSGFPLGGTPVRCTATDSSGNVATGTFLVSVVGSTSSHLKVCAVGQPASAMIFPLFDSTRGRGTIITVTNTDTDRDVCSNRFREGDVCVHYVYFGFDAQQQLCREFDLTECLTPGDTLTVFADQHNPEGDLGWLWVEARDPETGRAIDFDHLIGSAVVVDMGTDFLFHYLPYGFRSYANDQDESEPDTDACGHAFTDVDYDGCADFDGVEYDYWPQRLLLDEFFQQGNATGGFANELTLASCDVDPFDHQPTIVNAHPWNNRERRFSATFDFECFFKAPLAPALSNVVQHLQGDPNELVFGGHHLQTGWLELDANQPILGVFHQRVIGTAFAAGHQLEFAGQFGGPCDDNPNHRPCCLRRN